MGFDRHLQPFRAGIGRISFEVTMVLARVSKEWKIALVMALSLGVGLVVDLEKLLDGRVRIFLRCREGLVSQHFLDGPQVRALV